MKSTHPTLGMPNTLAPLSPADVGARLWLAFSGALLVTISLIPSLAHSRIAPFLFLACWLVLPVKGAVLRFYHRRNEPAKSSGNFGEKLYAAIVVSSGASFVVWARHLALSWPVTLGALLFIEGLASVIASLTEWWRLSTIGLSLAVITCGLGFPFVPWSDIGAFFGAAIVLGSLLSAGILRWQIRRTDSRG